MATKLSPLDANFLELEDGDSSAHMHIGGALVFDAVRGGAPDLEAVTDHLQRRMRVLPRFSQRLSSPTVAGLAWPDWVSAEGFRIADHVRRASLPAPGGDAELTEWLGDFYSHRLDRTRPLWEMVVLDGLAGGRWALVTKTHHSMVDGVGSMDIGHVLLDATPDAEWQGEEASAREENGAPGWLERVGQAVANVALHPRDVAGQARSAAELLVRDELIAAPATSLNVPIGATRRFAVVRADLEGLKAVKRRLGGTVNDVVLAIAAGGLRELLLARGEEPPANGLRAMVPVNVRDSADRDLGNRVSSIFVELDVAEPDPLLRYARVVRRAEQMKSGTQARGGQALVGMTNLLPPAAHAALARVTFTPRMFNLTITNVPGPQLTLYALGARLREILPLVPLYAGHAVGIAVVSYDGGVCFGLNADRASVPDLDALRDGIERSLAELQGHGAETHAAA